MEDLHESPVRCIKFNPVYGLVVSTDVSANIEIWDPDTHEMPDPETDKRLRFELMSDTDYYDLAINQTYPVAIAFSNDGTRLAVYGQDSIIRVFHFSTGKIIRRFDETIQSIAQMRENPE